MIHLKVRVSLYQEGDEKPFEEIVWKADDPSVMLAGRINFACYSECMETIGPTTFFTEP